MQNGIFFSIISLFYCILIIFIYFLKKRIGSKENKIYGILLLTTLIGLIIEVFPSTYAIKVLLEDHYNLSIFILKLILVYFIIWISIFTYYVTLISLKDEEVRGNKFLEKEKKVLMINAIISIILIYILPLSAVNNHGAACTYGMAANFVYLYSIILIIYWIILLFKNIKNILNKKYYPIFTFIGLGMIVMAIQYKYPELTLMISMQAFVICLMYFTIENPDLQLLRELHKAREYVENSNNEKSTFLFNITQQLREPLREISRLSKDSLMENDNEIVKNNLTEIKYSAKNALSLVNSVLDISELENRKISITENKYQPANLFESLMRSVKLQAKEKNLDFRFNYDQSIPEYLCGDSLRLKQILGTLLENAVTHTNIGFIEMSVNSVVKYDVCRLIITVEDSGVGMEVEQLNNLFDKNKKEISNDIDDSQKNLVFIKTLIDLIGGTITVNSEIGKGSKFVVVMDQKIPIKKENELSKMINQYENIYVYHDHVLVVTADEQIEKKLSTLFKKLHVDYSVVKNGQECLEKIRNEESYQLILIDETLPKLSTVHTFDKLRAIDNFNIPVILITKHKDIETKDSYINMGFSDIVTVPINREEVKFIVDKYI